MESLNIALAGFGAALGIFFAAALFLGRAKVRAQIFLAGFCACFALLMIGDIVAAIFQASGPVWLSSVMDWAFLLLAPLFYFYVFALSTGKRVEKGIFLWSLLPSSVSLGSVISRIVFASPYSPPASPAVDFMPATYTIMYFVVAATQLIGYCVAAYRLVEVHVKRAEHTYSALEGIDLRWLQTLIWGAGFAALSWLVSVLVRHPLLKTLTDALPALIILMLGILALHQRSLKISLPRLDAEPGLSLKTGVAVTDAAPKYAKSGLTAERMRNLANQLDAFMSRDKAFLENDLTLDVLTSRTDIAPHHLSQVLNQHLGMSFFEYINRLRVNEVKRCLADSAFTEQTVLEIGLASGFNSKAAFNAAFKRYTGTTPTLYRSQIRSQTNTSNPARS